MNDPEKRASRSAGQANWASPFRGLRVPARSPLLAWLILATTIAVMLVVFWPGRLNIDTFGQIAEVATGEFTNRSTPLLHALWHPLWDLGFGPEAVFAAQVLTFVIGAYLVLRAAFRPIGAAAITALLVFWPPVLGNLASVQRDAWFAALLVLTFGIVVRATQRSWPIRGRYLALAIIAAWFALATRQNAAAAVVLACVVIAGLLLDHWRGASSGARESRPVGWSGILGAVAGGVGLLLALMATQVVGTKMLSPTNLHPEAPLYVYDLAAISKRERENLFPSDLMPQRGIAPIDRTYDVDSALPFLFPEVDTIGPQFARAVGFPNVGDSAAASLKHAWRNAVTEHPGSYVSARWTLWLRQIGVTRDGLSVYPPDSPDNGGDFPFSFPKLYQRAMSYLEAFTYPDRSFGGQAGGGNVLFAVWIYLLAALLAAIVLVRRDQPLPLVIVGTLGLSALTYQIGLFFVALATRFRFELPSIVIGMLTAAILLHIAWTRWRARSGSPA